MLVRHGDPVHSIHHRAFPFIRDYIQRVMAVGSSWLKQIMNLFIYDLDEANFDREGEVGVHVSCASSILPVTLILQNVEKVVSKE